MEYSCWQVASLISLKSPRSFRKFILVLFHCLIAGTGLAETPAVSKGQAGPVLFWANKNPPPLARRGALHSDRM